MKDTQLEFQHILKWNGVISIGILHLTNFFLIYLPINYIFPAFQTMIGQRIEENYNERVSAAIAYVFAFFPFIGLMFTYHKFGRRWAKLEVVLRENGDGVVREPKSN